MPHLPRISPASPKIGSATPPHLPRASAASPPHLPRATPSLPKGREYGVPPSGERHTPMPVPGQNSLCPSLSGRRLVAAEANLGAQLSDLASRVRRLAPSHRDPESFHAEKSEIEHELRRLARTATGR